MWATDRQQLQLHRALNLFPEKAKIYPLIGKITACHSEQLCKCAGLPSNLQWFARTSLQWELGSNFGVCLIDPSHYKSILSRQARPLASQFIKKISCTAPSQIRSHVFAAKKGVIHWLNARYTLRVPYCISPDSLINKSLNFPNPPRLEWRLHL